MGSKQSRPASRPSGKGQSRTRGATSDPQQAAQKHRIAEEKRKAAEEKKKEKEKRKEAKAALARIQKGIKNKDTPRTKDKQKRGRPVPADALSRSSTRSVVTPHGQSDKFWSRFFTLLHHQMNAHIGANPNPDWGMSETAQMLIRVRPLLKAKGTVHHPRQCTPGRTVVCVEMGLLFHVTMQQLCPQLAADQE